MRRNIYFWGQKTLTARQREIILKAAILADHPRRPPSPSSSKTLLPSAGKGKLISEYLLLKEKVIADEATVEERQRAGNLQTYFVKMYRRGALSDTAWSALGL